MQRIYSWCDYWCGKVQYHDPALIAPKLYYLCFFAAIGALAPFFNIFFVGFGAACYANFAGLRLISLGGSSGQVGLAFALGALTEVPVMYLGARLALRFGTVKLLLGGLLGLAAVYALAGLAPTPTLHATGMSLVGAAQGGLGVALGGVTAGILWDALGGTAVLLTGAASLAIGAGIFLQGQRQAKDRGSAEAVRQAGGVTADEGVRG